MKTVNSTASDLIFEKCIAIDALIEMKSTEILSHNEQIEQIHWKAKKRRKQWLTGRYLCKTLISEHALAEKISLNQIEILSRNNKKQSVRPEVYLHKKKQPWSLSISHTDEFVWVVLSLDEQTRIGIDLVPASHEANRHLLQWFSKREQECWKLTSSDEIAIHWAHKEAIYKAINNGESFSPQQIEILKSTTGAIQYIVAGADFSRRIKVHKKYFHDHIAIQIELQCNE